MRVTPRQHALLPSARVVAAVFVMFSCASACAQQFHTTLRQAQQKVVKVYGAGGLRQLEAYQTGILVSPEGHVLTTRSYVLDTDDLAVTLDDGRRYEAELLGSDPVLEIALLKLPVEEPCPYFDIKAAPIAEPGDRVLALSNLYNIAQGDEPVSVLQGVVTAVAPLSARRGRYAANYRGKAYMVDAHSNNPGATGGALVDWRGRLLGILGKELRSELTGGWLHYALPVAAFSTAVEDMKLGRETSSAQLQLAAPEQPLDTATLGFSLVPEVLPKTPPYLDFVVRGSPADLAGLQPDDLIVFIDNTPTASCQAVAEALATLEATVTVRIAVLRSGELMEFAVSDRGPNTSSTPQPDSAEGSREERPRSTIKVVE